MFNKNILYTSQTGSNQDHNDIILYLDDGTIKKCEEKEIVIL